MKANYSKLIEQRTLDTARYMINNCCTVRDVAKHFQISKSVVHNDFVKRLRNLSQDLYEQVEIVMQINKEERTMRGGIATKNKFKKHIDIK